LKKRYLTMPLPGKKGRQLKETEPQWRSARPWRDKKKTSTQKGGVIFTSLGQERVDRGVGAVDQKSSGGDGADLDKRVEKGVTEKRWKEENASSMPGQRQVEKYKRELRGSLKKRFGRRGMGKWAKKGGSLNVLLS